MTHKEVHPCAEVYLEVPMTHKVDEGNRFDQSRFRSSLPTSAPRSGCSRTHAKKSPLSASGFLERLDIGHIVRKFQSLAFLTILLLLIILAIVLL